MTVLRRLGQSSANHHERSSTVNIIAASQYQQIISIQSIFLDEFKQRH